MFKVRSKSRPKDGWHKMEGCWSGGYVRDLRGRHLVIFHGKTPEDTHWYKWIDGYFRGSTEKLRVAKQNLEREALGGDLAWGSKLEREAAYPITAVLTASETPTSQQPLPEKYPPTSHVGIAGTSITSIMDDLLAPCQTGMLGSLQLGVVKKKEEGEADEATA